MTSVNHIVEDLIARFEVLGVKVDVQRAVTTSSVYLTLDNGILKRIRVGDHRGKTKYHYTYEIGTHIKNRHDVHREYFGRDVTSYRFPAEMTADLVERVMINRMRIKYTYGNPYYQRLLSGAVGQEAV